MDRDVSLASAVDMPIRREESLLVAVLLAIVGGYLEAYTWIIHRVFANAQTGNMLFFFVYAADAQWEKALHYVPPLTAFALGVITACCLRRFAGAKSCAISLLVEIVVLILVAILHNRLPSVAGTWGISFVAAVQTAIFPRVETWSYSSVMATSNLRQSIESLFGALTGTADSRPFRRPSVFAIICVAFGVGATAGAYMTFDARPLAMGIPVVLLLTALLFCATPPAKD